MVAILIRTSVDKKYAKSPRELRGMLEYLLGFQNFYPIEKLELSKMVT